MKLLSKDAFVRLCKCCGSPSDDRPAADDAVREYVVAKRLAACGVGETVIALVLGARNDAEVAAVYLQYVRDSVTIDLRAQRVDR